MAGIDLGTRIIKVNVPKLRRDDTISPASPGIALDPPLSRLGAKTTTVNLVDSFSEVCSEDGTPFDQALWNCETKGRIHVLEIFAGSAKIQSMLCFKWYARWHTLRYTQWFRFEHIKRSADGLQNNPRTRARLDYVGACLWTMEPDAEHK